MAKVKLDKKLFTANFKRDYVAASAVGIFILIVLSEIVLAVSIPVYFVRSDLWDLQIAGQQLMTEFDSLRSFCHDLSSKNGDIVEENNILLWDLNLMANYLRTNRKNLSRAEIAALREDLVQLRRFAEQLKQGKVFNAPIRLRTAAAQASIRKEFTQKDPAK